MNQNSIQLLGIIESLHCDTLNLNLRNISVSKGNDTFAADTGTLTLDESKNPRITIHNLDGNSFFDHLRLTYKNEDLIVKCTYEGHFSCEMIRMGSGSAQLSNNNSKLWFSPDEIRISSLRSDLRAIHHIRGTFLNYRYRFNKHEALSNQEYIETWRTHSPFDAVTLNITNDIIFREQHIHDTDIRLFGIEDDLHLKTEKEGLLQSEALLYSLAFVGCQKIEWRTLLLENANEASLHLYNTRKNCVGNYSPIFPFDKVEDIHSLLALTLKKFIDDLDDGYKAALDVYHTHTEVSELTIEIFLIVTAIESIVKKYKGLDYRYFYENACKAYPHLFSKIELKDWVKYRHEPAHGTFQYLRREDLEKQKELRKMAARFATLFNEIMLDWIGYSGGCTDWETFA